MTKEQAIAETRAEYTGNLKRAAFVLLAFLARLEQVPECADIGARARAKWQPAPGSGVEAMRPAAVIEFLFAALE